MLRSLRLAAAAAALCLLVPAATVQADTPLDVHFVVPTTIDDENPGPTFGPFTATGPAVDAGLICPSGDTIDLGAKVMPWRVAVEPGVNFMVWKQFTCDDGSGMFVAKLQVRINRNGDNFAWVIVGGTGEYERLRGAGSGYGTPIPEGVLDVYDGGVHLD